MSVKVLWKCGKRLGEESAGLWQYYLLPDNYTSAVKNNMHLHGTSGGSTFTISKGYAIVKNGGYSSELNTPQFWYVHNTGSISFNIENNSSSNVRYDSVVIIVDNNATATSDGLDVADIRYVVGEASLGRELTEYEIRNKLGLSNNYSIARLYTLKIDANSTNIIDVIDRRQFISALYGAGGAGKGAELTLTHHGVLGATHLQVLDDGVGNIIIKEGRIFLPNRIGDKTEPYVTGILPNDLNLSLTFPTNKRVAAIVAYNNNDPINPYAINITPVYGTDGTAWDKPDTSEIESQLPNNAHYSVIAYVYQDGNSSQYIVDARNFTTLYNRAPNKNYVMNSDLQLNRFGRYSSDWSKVTDVPTDGTYTSDGSSGMHETGFDVFIEDETEIKPGDHVCISGVIEKTSGTGEVLVEAISDNGSSTSVINSVYVFVDGENATEERLFVIPTTLPGDIKKLRILIKNNSVCKISKIKLERGNILTQYIARRLKRIPGNNTLLLDYTHSPSNTGNYTATIDIWSIKGNKRFAVVHALLGNHGTNIHNAVGVKFENDGAWYTAGDTNVLPNDKFLNLPVDIPLNSEGKFKVVIHTIGGTSTQVRLKGIFYFIFE